jgi:transitional endoplasmic reticulum ATPase
MDEHHIVRSILLRIGRSMPATTTIAKAVIEWAQPHADWLIAGACPEGELGWDALLDGVARAEAGVDGDGR